MRLLLRYKPDAVSTQEGHASQYESCLVDHSGAAKCMSHTTNTAFEAVEAHLSLEQQHVRAGSQTTGGFNASLDAFHRLAVIDCELKLVVMAMPADIRSTTHDQM